MLNWPLRLPLMLPSRFATKRPQVFERSCRVEPDQSVRTCSRCSPVQRPAAAHPVSRPARSLNDWIIPVYYYLIGNTVNRCHADAPLAFASHVSVSPCHIVKFLPSHSNGRPGLAGWDQGAREWLVARYILGVRAGVNCNADELTVPGQAVSGALRYFWLDWLRWTWGQGDFVSRRMEC